MGRFKIKQQLFFWICWWRRTNYKGMLSLSNLIINYYPSSCTACQSFRGVCEDELTKLAWFFMQERDSSAKPGVEFLLLFRVSILILFYLARFCSLSNESFFYFFKKLLNLYFYNFIYWSFTKLFLRNTGQPLKQKSKSEDYLHKEYELEHLKRSLTEIRYRQKLKAYRCLIFC